MFNSLNCLRCRQTGENKPAREQRGVELETAEKGRRGCEPNG